jgi:hypothetical protein
MSNKIRVAKIDHQPMHESWSLAVFISSHESKFTGIQILPLLTRSSLGVKCKNIANVGALNESRPKTLEAIDRIIGEVATAGKGTGHCGPVSIAVTLAKRVTIEMKARTSFCCFDKPFLWISCGKQSFYSLKSRR